MTSQQTVNRGRIRLEPSPKRVRVQLGGLTVADSGRAVLVWEKPYYPTYYFPIDDVRTDLLNPDPGVSHSPSRGDGTLYTVTAGARTVPGAAVRYEQSPIPQLRDLVRFDWDAMDHWFEEDEEVYTHPRDPYTRVDILASSRRVQVEVDGVTVADSTSPRVATPLKRKAPSMIKLEARLADKVWLDSPRPSAPATPRVTKGKAKASAEYAAPKLSALPATRANRFGPIVASRLKVARRVRRNAAPAAVIPTSSAGSVASRAALRSNTSTPRPLKWPPFSAAKACAARSTCHNASRRLTEP